MAKYKISGVWKNDDGVITHYAVHTVTDKGHTRGEKMLKANAISLLEKPGNTALTWMWNYSNSFWQDGATVDVVNGLTGKYLRTIHDNTLKDNLAHLIDYDWIL